LDGVLKEPAHCAVRARLLGEDVCLLREDSIGIELAISFDYGVRSLRPNADHAGRRPPGIAFFAERLTFIDFVVDGVHLPVLAADRDACLARYRQNVPGRLHIKGRLERRGIMVITFDLACLAETRPADDL